MGSQQYIPPETAEEVIKARLIKKREEAERRDAYLRGNYFRENIGGGDQRSHVIDWSQWR